MYCAVVILEPVLFKNTVSACSKKLQLGWEAVLKVLQHTMPAVSAESSGKGRAKVRARAGRSVKAPEGHTKTKKTKTRTGTKMRRKRSTSAARRSTDGILQQKKKKQSTKKYLTDQSKSQHICPICHESYSASTFPVVHAPCGHVACAHCSLQWQLKKSARTCALCRTPILSIAHCQLLEQLLLQQSSDAEAREPEDASPDAATAQATQDSERSEIKKALRDLSQGDLNNLPGDYRSHAVRLIATRAVRKGDLTMLKECLQSYRARASTNLLSDVAAYWTGEPKSAISLALAHGARINGHCEDRPLFTAVARGHNKMVSALLELKADPDRTTGPEQETALHIAARCGQFEAARILLDHGVRANAVDGAGRTPLHMAEKGLEMHMNSCEYQPCDRCEARIQLRGELRWRAKATASEGALETQTEPAAPAAEENDAASVVSSSEWDESTDVSDVGEWLEGEEEEEEETGEREEDR
eukprot:TRINITY_DN42395_c0_g1_i1.p1 TRINITY_DN42395_c0_g1~~TRINITY_DN42395_c0_g1_i1.p1  ORF type:complete len:473 (+),score=75.99 TRINITY_DN42395_c0_g1_i1:42-1460(+)